jgi:hypothetical protein
MNEGYDPEKQGWYGAGWASFKSDYVPAGFMPPLTDADALTDWLDGFRAAHADCPDDEAIAGILEGDFIRGELWQDALLRIAPALYAELAQTRQELLS